jgi:hypothetical protein
VPISGIYRSQRFEDVIQLPGGEINSKILRASDPGCVLEIADAVLVEDDALYRQARCGVRRFLFALRDNGNSLDTRRLVLSDSGKEQQGQQGESSGEPEMCDSKHRHTFLQ